MNFPGFSGTLSAKKSMAKIVGPSGHFSTADPYGNSREATHTFFL